MNIRETLSGLGEFWDEFRKSVLGLVGLTILILFVLVGSFGQYLIPFPGATENWRNIDFWQDNPQAAPPVWTNLPWGSQAASSDYLIESRTEITDLDNGVKQQTWTIPYHFTADQAPRDVIFAFDGIGQVPVILTVTRPDGKVVEVSREQLDLVEQQLTRFSVTNSGAQNVIEFVRSQDEELASSMQADIVKPTRMLFSKIEKTMENLPVTLKGDYVFTVTALYLNEQAKLESPTVRISGFVSGLLGTDISKRDIFTGIVIGIRWALIIGLLTSLITVLIGVLLGVIAAYFGGKIDWVINRVYEYFYLMPIIPFLIVIAAIFKITIWWLIALIVIFFWSGAFKPVYGMALQLKEEVFVEASRALGASKWRIILRHIFPMVLPYSFAVMALSVPGVIVYEATVSILGLGDPSIVSWGQILHDAEGQGAVINNLWWWVVPPGLMIALMGMAFVFLGTALDKILQPKLKTR
ncbi:MAG: ABC transporter permease [Spirochaetales bacterium]